MESVFNAEDYGIDWPTTPQAIIEEALREYVGDEAVEAVLDAFVYTVTGEALTEAFHPEFGTEWREDGLIYKAVAQASKHAWGQGYSAAESDFEQPDRPKTVNPYVVDFPVGHFK